MAIGNFDFGLMMCGINLSASSDPSIRTSLGRTRSSNWRKCHAAAGERWRTPKMWGEEAAVTRIGLLHVRLARRIQPAPGRAPFLHHVAQVIFPDNQILVVVLDDGALQAGSQVVIADLAIPEIARQ